MIKPINIRLTFFIKTLIIGHALLFSLCNLCTAQEPPSSKEKNFENTPLTNYHLQYRLKNDAPYVFKSTIRHTGKIITSPFQWEGSDFLKFGLLGGGTALLMHYDETIHQNFQQAHSPGLDRVAAISEPFGDYRLAGIPMVLSWSYGMLAKKEKPIKWAYTAIESAVITGMMVQVMKWGLQRARPHENLGPHRYDGPAFDPEASLPSNHAAMAFVLARSLDHYTEGAWPYIGYSIASLTALSRIYEGEHWAGDVLVGAALGYFITEKVIDLKLGENMRVSFRLVVGGNW